MKYLAIISTVFLASCVASGHRFTPVNIDDPTQSIIYIYRLPQDGGQRIGNELPYIYVNGESLFRFSYMGYSTLRVKPGSYTFIAKDSFMLIPGKVMASETIEIKEGATYYVRYKEEITSKLGWVTGKTFSLADKEEALKEIKDNRYLEPESKTYAISKTGV